MATEIQEYSETESALAVLREKYHGVIFDCSKAKEMKEAKSARGKFVKVRTSLEKMRVQIKGPALKHCQQIDSESNRIKAEILELEESIDQQIKKEENRKAEIKAEKDREAREEYLRFSNKIQAIRSRPLDYINATPDQIFVALTKARGLTSDMFPPELRDEAFNALEGAIKKLEEMHIAALDAVDKSEKLEQAQAVIESIPLNEDDPTWPKVAENNVVDHEVDWTEPKEVTTIWIGRDPVDQRITSGAFKPGPAESSAPIVSSQIKKSDPFAAAKTMSAHCQVLGRSTRIADPDLDTQSKIPAPVRVSTNPLLPAAKAACQYLESDPNSRGHIITRNLRAAIDRVL